MDQVHVHAAEGIVHLKESAPDAALPDACHTHGSGDFDVTTQSDVEVP
ncbi:hypothetical protein [Streptomyces sp. NPDC059349]